MTKKENREYEVLSPWAEADPIPLKGISPRIESLAGKKIGLLRNSKRAALPIMNVVERRLKEKFPTAEFTEFANLRPNEMIIEQDAKNEFEDWLKGVDAVIATFGDWGSCTKYLVYDSIVIEDRKKPTVTLVNSGFANDAGSASSSKGMPVLRYIPTSIPCEASIMEDIEAGVDEAFEAIVTALTKPLTSEEKSPKPKEIEKPARIIFKGSLEEVNRFFYQRGWTDGLPIIPPTEEAVADLLTGTDLPPDHLLGKLESRLGKATIEKITINAVMAGALPTYMPVLIAGTKLLLESERGFMGYTTFGFSTGSWAPFWIINGPVRNEIHVNNSSGALSPGNIANAAIGRAMGLIIKNIGGVRKGIEDMGVMGNPMKYSMVIAENEEDSPWEPLHVEHGYKQEESTITLSFPQTYLQHWPYSSDAEGILRAVMDNLPRGMRYTFIFTPPHAKNLEREGWTKEDVKEFISEFARMPGARFNSMPGFGGVRPGLYKGKISARGTDTVAFIRDPRFIRIIVAGGPGAFIAHVVGGGATPGKKQTQKIDFPKNWDKLVAKYKNVVPTYARY